MSHVILLVGQHTPREREIVERALYSGWEIADYQHTEGGRFACVVVDRVGTDPAYQYGRLCSFGSWGVTLDPDVVDALRAGVRAAGGVPA